MRVRLARRAEDEATVTLGARVAVDSPLVRLRYSTFTGALLRIDGAVAGAFDAGHGEIDVPVTPGERDLELVVERHGLPIAWLPAGDGVRWRWLQARAHARPRTTIDVHASTAHYGARPGATDTDPPLAGHAHLDVAWLWQFDATRRKAQRTFATALRQLRLDPRYVYLQSQPQLYAWVEHDAPALFEAVREHVGRGWDAGVAAMWVEPDLHAPSGESILRQFLFAARYLHERFARTPDVVWLPDTFGFPSTLPTLAVHAGVRFFATTKLQWNDTTRWPHPQFSWYGDDDSVLVSALIDRYDGAATHARANTARERHEILVHGFGDGGGGVPDDDLRAQPGPAPWRSLGAWMDEVAHRVLPAYRGELYLETHRGTYTTHHDVKARNAALERTLGQAEEAVAWCTSVRAPASAVRPLADDLRTAWTLVLKNQFHDVIAGSSIGPVYDDVKAEYERAERIVARVIAGAQALLPRADVARQPQPVAPRPDGRGFVLANGVVRARVRADGTFDELAGVDGHNVVALANGLVLAHDRPRRYDAWNLDRGYDRRTERIRPGAARIVDDGIEIPFSARDVALTMRIALHAGEPFVRVELAVRWNTSHRILRVEHRVAVRTDVARFGQPHGTLLRSAVVRSAADRARFEVPAQRFAHVDDGGHGFAAFAPDTYGWNALALRRGGVRLGMSLLRAPTWPDPGADRGEHQIAYALAPTAGATIGDLEAAWSDYAEPSRVRLFGCDDPAVLVVATKPADDGDGIVVRVRECNGAARAVDLVCTGRMRTAEAVDACERPVAGEALVEGERLRFMLPAFGLRSFRVRP